MSRRLRSGMGGDGDLFYARFDDIRRIMDEHPSIKAVFEENAQLANSQNIIASLLVINDAGLFDIEEAREELDRSVSAFLRAGSSDPEILSIFKNIILTMGANEILTLQNLKKIIEQPSLDHLKAITLFVTVLHTKELLNEQNLDILLSNFSEIARVISGMHPTFDVMETYTEIPDEYWNTMFNPNLNKADLNLIADFLARMNNSMVFSEPELSDFFSGIDLALAERTPLIEFIRQFPAAVEFKRERELSPSQQTPVDITWQTKPPEHYEDWPREAHTRWCQSAADRMIELGNAAHMNDEQLTVFREIGRAADRIPGETHVTQFAPVENYNGDTFYPLYDLLHENAQFYPFEELAHLDPQNLSAVLHGEPVSVEKGDLSLRDITHIYSGLKQAGLENKEITELFFKGIHGLQFDKLCVENKWNGLIEEAHSMKARGVIFDRDNCTKLVDSLVGSSWDISRDDSELTKRFFYENLLATKSIWREFNGVQNPGISGIIEYASGHGNLNHTAFSRYSSNDIKEILINNYHVDPRIFDDQAMPMRVKIDHVQKKIKETAPIPVELAEQRAAASHSRISEEEKLLVRKFFDENKDVSSFFIFRSKDDLHRVTFDKIINFAYEKYSGPGLDFLADRKLQVKAAFVKYGVDAKIINDPSTPILEKVSHVMQKMSGAEPSPPKTGMGV